MLLAVLNFDRPLAKKTIVVNNSLLTNNWRYLPPIVFQTIFSKRVSSRAFRGNLGWFYRIIIRWPWSTARFSVPYAGFCCRLRGFSKVMRWNSVILNWNTWTWLGHNWSSLQITFYVTGENSSIFGKPKSVNYLLRLVIIPALNWWWGQHPRNRSNAGIDRVIYSLWFCI